MRYRVESDALRDDAARLGEALQALERVDVGSALAPLAGAVPGGLTASATREVGNAWGERMLRVRVGLVRGVESLSRAADGYERLEGEAGSVSGKRGNG